MGSSSSGMGTSVGGADLEMVKSLVGACCLRCLLGRRKCFLGRVGPD